MRTRYRSAAVAAAALLALSGCTSNDGGTGSTAATIDSALLTPSGGKQTAAGAPISIGLINDEGGSASSFPEIRIGVEAALKYANDYLGGVDGRPVVLDSCDSKANSASSAACANQMIADHVVAVLHGPESDGATTTQTLMNAGIPVISSAPASTPEMMGNLSFSLSGGATAFIAALGEWMAEQNYKSSVLFAVDAPGGTTLYQSAVTYLQKRGITTTLIPVAPGTADITPQMASALGHNPDFLWIVGDAGLCLSFMQAYRASGSTAQIGLVGQCTDPQVTKVVSLDGAISPQYATPLADHPEARLYRAVLNAYAPGTDHSGLAFVGYTMALGTVRALHGLSGDITAETVAGAIRAARDVVLPVADGVTFTCDGKQVPPFPAPCSDTVFVTRMDAKGNTTVLEKIRAASLFGG
ncbi:ABC transporter substrate-binding protein [Nocardia sp. NBC_00565]|uniref:ABC transporter substrate-binding protein n=1 Tax=Nocardia sp. NBC_00565 TaxID=2975993 RepID=UPI002E80C187|nr:ABC transporter substrate-binding protein [Nocardia sp. NBC_00565]WUC05601.1 ABC transporter substrate-binding protein [Nocardia sp. NBC_00565]